MEQSIWLRTRGLGVQIPPGAPSYFWRVPDRLRSLSVPVVALDCGFVAGSGLAMRGVGLSVHNGAPATSKSAVIEYLLVNKNKVLF